MGAQQSGPSTYTIQSTDSAGNAIGAPITGVDSGTYPDYGHIREIESFGSSVFGTIGSGASDLWNLGLDGATEIIHLPRSVIDTAGSTITNVAREAGAAVGNVTGAASDIFSSPILLVGGAAVVILLLR